MRTLRYAALSIVLVAASLPAQAQAPEEFPGLLDVLTPDEEAGSFIAGVCDGTCELSHSPPFYPLPPEGIGPARVVPADPLDLCSTISNGTELLGAFAIVDVGSSGCGGFRVGILQVAAVGGRGVVFFDGDASPEDDETLFNITWDSAILTPFPAVVITRYRAERLLAAIEAGEEVTAMMRMNPAVVSGEPGVEPKVALDLSVYPSPSSSPSVALELERPEAVRVAVYDVLGREVAALHDGVLGAGPQRFAVDGLPAGLYIVRAEGASVQATRRLTVLR